MKHSESLAITFTFTFMLNIEYGTKEFKTGELLHLVL